MWLVGKIPLAYHRLLTERALTTFTPKSAGEQLNRPASMKTARLLDRYRFLLRFYRVRIAPDIQLPLARQHLH
jgi:hypothetical protein